MVHAIVRFALRHRFAVLAAVVALVALVAGGAYSFSKLPIEAYPDVADTWVQVITQWPGHAAEEVERQVSLPNQVSVDPERLAAHGVGLTDVLEALSRSNRNAGGGFIEVGPQAVNVGGVAGCGAAGDGGGGRGGLLLPA